MSLTQTQILAEIAANLPDNTAGSITPALVRQVLSDMTNSSFGAISTYLNVLNFGAKGDGVTDDSAAINSALTALSAAGGGTLYFPGGGMNYLMATSTLTPPSNCVLQGGGIDATTITNTSTTGGQDSTLTVVMTMTGGKNASTWTSLNTTYPINAPTMGATTVTTTTPANAGNFSPGDIIMISGDTHGSAFWFPSWYTTVVSANASTGVITLAETLPLGGAQLTTVQKIISLPKNITVRDMTLAVNSNIGGVSGGLMEILGVDTFLIENVKFVNLDQLSGAGIALGAPARRSGYRNCHASKNAGPIELFGASESFIEGCTTIQNGLLIDGGSFDCAVMNNHIKDPLNVANLAASYGISIPDYAQRIRVIGNSITGIPNGSAGISVTDTSRLNQNNIIVGNTLVGAGGSGGTGAGMFAGSMGIVANLFSNLQIGVEAVATDVPVIGDNYYDAENPNGTNVGTFSGTGQYRTQTNPTIQTMAAGTATPTIQGGQKYNLAQSGAQNITSFVGGLGGDEITIVVIDNNTTFKNGSNLHMKGGIDYNPQGATNNIVMCFICNSAGTWTEKSRSA